MKSKLVAKTRVFKIYQQPLGYEYATLFEDTVDSVMIVPITSKDEFILIKQYLPAMDKYSWLFPGGKVDERETSKDSAQRELIEETHYRALSLIALGAVDILPKYINAQTCLFLASDLKFSDEFQGDEVETHQVQKFSKEQVIKMINQNEITDSRSIAAFFLAIRKLESKDV